METPELKVATEFCQLVGSRDLLEYLGLPEDAAPDQARAALKQKRGWFQSMQGNPKYREVAKYLIKHYRVLDQVLAEPSVHLARVAREHARAHLPLLEMAIDSVFADGVLTTEEVVFVRENAENLGISPELVDQLLAERAEAMGIALPAAPPPVPARVRSATAAPALGGTGPFLPRRHKGVAGQGWWDEAFSRLLIEAVPPGTTRLVDLAAGMGWAALTLLQALPDLEYLGIERDEERLGFARRALDNSPVGDRVALMAGEAHALPIPEGAVDVVLCAMALHQTPDTAAAMAEAVRVLRPGGRVILVEPERRSRRAWFNGPLAGIDACVQKLVDHIDEALESPASPQDRPSLSLGPRVAERLQNAGLRPAHARVHPLREAFLEDMESFAERLASHAERWALRAGLGRRAAPLLATMVAIDDAEERVGARALGLGATMTPAFLCTGVKP